MPARPKNNKLTDREAAFVREYLVDKIITQAAIRAGYSPRTAYKSGSEAFARPLVQAAIRKALKEQERRTLITADDNLVRIDRLADRAEREGDLGAAIRASELIGKHFRSFAEKVEFGEMTVIVKDYTGRKRDADV